MRALIRASFDAVWSFRPLRILVPAAGAVWLLIGTVALWGWLTSNLAWFWSVQTIEQIVFGGILFLSVIGVAGGITTIVLPSWGWSQWFREQAAHIGTAFVVLLGLYVAYTSFRNQARLTAELALSEESISLYDIEMDHPEIRCLYFNYGHEAPDLCLEELTRTQDAWSFAIFYVEESWFILERAHYDRVNWGSDFADWIRIWAHDVSRDPTGMFSYYLIATSDSRASARATMQSASVDIRDLCQNYLRVWGVLAGRGKLPRSVSGAAYECGIRDRPIYEVRE